MKELQARAEAYNTLNIVGALIVGGALAIIIECRSARADAEYEVFVLVAEVCPLWPVFWARLPVRSPLELSPRHLYAGRCALLEDRRHRMLIGALCPMLCPNNVSKVLASMVLALDLFGIAILVLQQYELLRLSSFLLKPGRVPAAAAEGGDGESNSEDRGARTPPDPTTLYQCLHRRSPLLAEGQPC